MEAAAWIIAFASGAAALIHELTWTRRLTDVLGAGTESAARVLGVFFLGLAVGAALTTRWKTARGWRAAAWVEFGIALTSLPILTVSYWTANLWPTMGAEALSHWSGTWVRWLITLGTVGPPALLMGSTLPLMANGFGFGRQSSATSNLAILYATNMFGGVFGLIFAMAWLLPNLGAAQTQLVAMGLNVIAGIGAFGLDRWTRSSPRLAPKTLESPQTKSSFDPWFWAFFSGFGTLAIETIGLHEFASIVPSATQATAAILAVILLVLATAASWSTRATDPLRWLVRAACASGLACALAPGLFVILTGMRFLEPSATAVEFLGQMLGLALLVLGPCILGAGFVFPLALTWMEREKQSHLGWLLAINGVGGLIGVQLTQSLLLPMLGPHCTWGLIGVAYAAFGAYLSVRFRLISWRWSIPLAFGVLGWTWGYDSKLPMIDLTRVQVIHEWTMDADGATAVVEHESHGRALVVRNQYTLGSTNGIDRQRRLGHLPLLLHPNPEKVAFLGLATGCTASAALDHKSVTSIEAIELSPAVARAARDWFADINMHLFDSPQFHLAIEDARIRLAASPQTFDVVVGDLFFPWEAGAGRLYSQEHFESAKKSLRPHGLFCQWLPLYQLTELQAQTIIKTFLQVFHQAELYRGDLGSTAPIVALIGFASPQDQPQVATHRIKMFQETNLTTDPFLRWPKIFDLLRIGTLSEPWPNQNHIPTNTLANAWIEFNAGQERVAGDWKNKYLVRSRFLQFDQTLVSNSKTPQSLWSYRILHQQMTNTDWQQFWAECPPALQQDARTHSGLWERSKLLWTPSQNDEKGELPS